MATEPCKKTVRVKTPAGKDADLIPKKVWRLSPSGRKGVKIGLFQDPETGKYFRYRVPEDYPECG
ncbi:MAG: chromatin protein Cren7 [Desulfurococcaceae archaeon]|uniref:Chromatin protein Cren7 n=1 Tax=Staphylothermus marinus TaxID=2280 RepID=A0A7C4D7C6_STAMA